RELYEALNRGEFCYVLTSRQMGKSSLMARTAARPREEGTQVAILDPTALGQHVTPEQWYESLLGGLGQRLHLEDELDAFWLANERLAPLRRWMAAIREVALPNLGVQVFRCSGAQERPAPTPQHLNTPTPEHPNTRT